MKPLIAITSCHAERYRMRRDAQRRTWLQSLNCDYKFFLGEGISPLRPDEVMLPGVDDSYKGLPDKTRAVARWARERGYTNVAKLDDDVYANGERLLASGFEAHEYCGRLRGPSGKKPALYCSGFTYWLGPRALEIVATAKPDNDTAEDRWVGNVLHAAGINAYADYRYVVAFSERNARSSNEGPLRGNNIISSCEYEPDGMQRAHEQWVNGAPSTLRGIIPNGTLSKVDLMIKTFLRDGFLFKTIRSVQKNLPDVRMVIVDDGFERKEKITQYAMLRSIGHACAWLPFDSGFGAKANEALKYLERPYVLIGSDDFNFGATGIRHSIEKLVTVLDNDQSVHLVSGRVAGRPYEATLELGEDYCREHKGVAQRKRANDVDYALCDLTVNYSLIRREVFEKVRWDGGEVKIGGGEHGAFFIDLKRAGFQCAVVEDVSIQEYPYDPSHVDLQYPKMRARARQPGRACLAKRGIKRYYLMDGGVEQCAC